MRPVIISQFHFSIPTINLCARLLHIILLVFLYIFKVVMKKAKSVNKPAKSLTTSTLKSGPRASVPTLKRLMHGQRYRKDLTAAALRKASAICRSQKPLPKRKGARAAKSE